MVYFPPSSSPNSDRADWDSDEEEDGLADQQPLEVTWVQVLQYRVAVCSLPGDRHGSARRSLIADMETLKKEGITDIFVVCTDAELRCCKVPSLVVDYLQRDFTPHQYPIVADQQPDMELCIRLLQDIKSCLVQGKKPVIHCIDGFGRSCLVLAVLSMLLDPDLPPVVAIEHIQRIRGPAAIQTIKQYNFVMDFQKNLAEFEQKRRIQPPSEQLLGTVS